MLDLLIKKLNYLFINLDILLLIKSLNGQKC